MPVRSHNFEIQVETVPLDRMLPVRGGEPFIQADHPITFLHVHDCLEIGYCFSGRGIFIVGEKVLEISSDVGFETLSSFNRLFLKRFGVSPRAWRAGAGERAQ